MTIQNSKRTALIAAITVSQVFTQMVFAADSGVIAEPNAANVSESQPSTGETAKSASKTVSDQKSDAPADTAVVSDAEKIANDAFWNRDYKTAKAQVTKLLANSDLSSERKARCFVNRAICEAQLDEWDDARKDASEAYRLAPQNSLTSADAAMILAREFLLESKTEKARAMYEQAIAYISSQRTRWDADLAPFYEGLAACYLIDKNYPMAEKFYKSVAQLDLLKYGPDDTHVAWSLMILGGVERNLGNVDLANKMYKKVFWNFRHQNELRILAEYKDAPNQDEVAGTLRHHLFGTTGAYENRDQGVDFLKSTIPAEVLAAQPTVRPKTFDNWFKERVGRERAPGFAFFNPTKPLKALLVAVHGLGLHSGAYAGFGDRIQKEGYGLVSFDVRGFGSYRNDEVTQKLDLPAAITDIQRILTEMRSDYPDTPIVLLGESMGGAIVLRIASESPHLVDAVISSVPSGSRFQAKKTALKVALKFLNHKHEQFDVGTAVVEQATVDADLRDMWEGDTQMRMKLSPAELLNFQTFMGENIKAAAKINKTPVIIFQGYSDNLVKPMGTLAIYQAIPNKDKDMIFIGRAEHLIFEESRFDEVIFRGVVEWISRHTTRNVGSQIH